MIHKKANNFYRNMACFLFFCFRVPAINLSLQDFFSAVKQPTPAFALAVCHPFNDLFNWGQESESISRLMPLRHVFQSYGMLDWSLPNYFMPT